MLASASGTRPAPRHLSDGAGFWIVTVAFLVVMASTTAQTPLYSLYQAREGFPTFIITVIFGAFAVGVVLGLWLVGSVSDWLGRRPLLLAGTALQLLAGFIEMASPALPALLVARVISGFGIGALSPAATAYLAELGARRGSSDRTIVAASTLASLGGLAVGPLVAGVAARLLPGPLVVPYAIFVAVLIVAGLGLYLTPDTVAPSTSRWRPERFTAPSGHAGTFAAAAVAAFASFAVFGLFTSLAPTFVAGQMHNDSLVVAGAVTFSVFASAATAEILLDGLAGPIKTIAAVTMVVLGLATVCTGALTGSLGVFVVGGVLAGGGNGLLFGTALTTVQAIAEPKDRGGVLGLVFLSAYIGLTVPALAVGALLQVVRPDATLIGFAILAGALALFAGASMLQHATDDQRGSVR